LGQHPETDNQVWHVPTAPALTGREFLELAAGVFHTPPEFMKVNKFMLQALGLFSKAIGETAEMYYQYEYDYIFSSEKFQQAFQVRPTAYTDGLKQLSQTLFKPSQPR
jgi:YHS domain-containing protein